MPHSQTLLLLLAALILPPSTTLCGEDFTNTVHLKQGVLQGTVVEPKLGRNVRKQVGVFKGVPYAAPPVGKLRFMYTADAPVWSGVKMADGFGPVCPQSFPDVGKMAPHRKEYFERLQGQLMNQSEDCLYLNIYAPICDDKSNTRKYPVMVFIHGESYEWNSGNPYDGSVLAAYGNVIVVTINFRLGVLGFLKAGVESQSKSNFGLVDQVAALLWVKDNIAAFKGDANSVTLFGHGTGAVCTSLLMISPMILKENERLFHRAILMSGTALADWAMAGNPTKVTYQVAKALNCQIHEDFAECLRKKRLDEIMAAVEVTSDYKTRFGPVVDSIVVPNDPKKSMTQYTDLFRRFEVMYGVTELESIDLLGPVALVKGLLEKERDQELRAYFHTRCEMKPELCLQRTMDEYAPAVAQSSFTGREPDKASVARDTLLDILSDARTVAPVVQTGRYHAALNLQSYFYVFTQRTNSKEYIRNKSYNGGELPYVFGVPMDGPKYHFSDSYTEQEKMFSEIVMMYFTNFAGTGNPNVPKRQIFYSMNTAYWAQFDIEWPEFDTQEEWYLQLDSPPQPLQHYRDNKIRYWNEIFPKLTENFSYNIDTPTKRTLLVPPRKTPPAFLYDNLPRRPTVPSYNSYMNFHKPDNIVRNVETVIESPAGEIKEASTMTIVVIVGVIFFLVNVLLLLTLYFKCYKKKKAAAASESLGDKKDAGDSVIFSGCSITRLMRKSTRSDDSYAVKTPKLNRQMSGSTLDAHTKVRQWIAQEIIQKYSPRFCRKTPSSRKNSPGDFTLSINAEGDSTMGRSPTRPASPVEEKPIPMRTSTITRPKVKAPKVSVGVDATPTGRGNSVLMQRPVELTKSLDCPSTNPELNSPLRRSFTLEDFSPRVVNLQEDTRKSATNVSLQQSDFQPTYIKIEHCHSKSDATSTKRLKTFDPNGDVNVTSREESEAPQPLSPEESLRVIKRRNFPKVLPDHPAMIAKRRSMPVAGFFVPIPESSSLSQKNSSLPKSLNRFPPAPPPRCSTLTKQTSNPLPVSVVLVEQPEEEPEIVCNNLYVGPLIPKKPAQGGSLGRLDRSERSFAKQEKSENEGVFGVVKKSRIPAPAKTGGGFSKESSSSDSSPSEGSDTGTVVKRMQ